MNRRALGLTMLAAGVVLIVAGVLAMGGSDEREVFAPTPTTETPITTTTTNVLTMTNIKLR